ncbi:uncharacterized protein MYCFIDRAFT_180135 [Pseudocercospora fijiensis CIRAD86]|uniref:Uncharacterized protein n=1 Tax=Pseudocercospora fijiensis (strain CIRAD86) TaxID=383855 RepID=M3AIW6_PSEFD|nr:uncharacterized protein MYCFIDRAFT_180135 [Pseudocercospora fijiensis CIRAD86]EME77133.1 hypothetical protein MYCFIDRAFT_180135 [Pseudocercospora fijiensis CIRAD86]
MAHGLEKLNGNVHAAPAGRIEGTSKSCQENQPVSSLPCACRLSILAPNMALYVRPNCKRRKTGEHLPCSFTAVQPDLRRGARQPAALWLHYCPPRSPPRRKSGKPERLLCIFTAVHLILVIRSTREISLLTFLLFTVGPSRCWGARLRSSPSKGWLLCENGLLVNPK